MILSLLSLSKLILLPSILNIHPSFTSCFVFSSHKVERTTYRIPMYALPRLNDCDCSAVLSHLALPHAFSLLFYFSFFGWSIYLRQILKKHNFQKILQYEFFFFKKKYIHNAVISSGINSNSLISSDTQLGYLGLEIRSSTSP